MLTPNQTHLAERDGQLAALRVLYSLRQHLDDNEDPADANAAGATFLLGFCDVFAECLADAIEEEQDGGAMRLFHSIIKRTPEMIASLDR